MVHFKLLITSCFLISLFSFNSYGQRQNAVWCFGDSIEMKFDSTSITVSKVTSINSVESSASISDKNGNLLFYVGGDTKNSIYGNIWNSSHQIMQNGGSIGLYASSTNGVLIIPFPNDSNKYYIISHNPYSQNIYQSFSLMYSVVDMIQNNGQGSVIIKNQYLSTDTVAEKLTLIKHGNGKDWWLIYHKLNCNTFCVSLIDSFGIQPPLQFNIGSQYNLQISPIINDDGIVGQLVSSTTGDRIASVGRGIIDLFNFDRCNGLISNCDNLYGGLVNLQDRLFYGCSFSVNGRFLYVSNANSISTCSCTSTNNSLFQFDLNAPNILSSKITIFNIQNSDYTLAQHRLSPNGKIYISRSNYSYSIGAYDSVNTYLSVINVPDSVGKACEFDLNSFYLQGAKTYFGLPNLPNYNLGRLIGSACDTLNVGLNELAQSNKNELVVYYDTQWQTAFINANGLKGRNYKLQLFNLNGQVILEEFGKLDSEFYTKNAILSSFADGMYIVRLSTEKEVLTTKFIK